MLFLDVPPFDLLLSQLQPYKGFGDVLSTSEPMQTQVARTAIEGRERISQVFGIDMVDCFDTPRIIDELVHSMWRDGWSPDGGNVNLFATDFGAVLTDAIQRSSGGSLIFRSATDLSHLSLWWPERGIEVFPFHKMYKRLLSDDCESVEFFVSRIRELTANVAGTRTDAKVTGN